MLVYEAFNGTFWLLMGLLFVFMLGTIKWLKTKDASFQMKYLFWFYLAGIAIFALYKYFLLKDQAYAAMQGKAAISLWEELPLNPCNIVLCMMPLVAITKKENLKIFCFYTSIIGAMTAMIIPADGFFGYSILLPRMLGYYVTHLIAFMAWGYLYFLKLYTPKLVDAAKLVVITGAVTLGTFALNMFLRLTGICETANYFYSIDPANDFLTSVHNLIPYPLLYVLPLLLVEGIFAAAVAMVFGGCELVGKIVLGRNEEIEETEESEEAV